MKNLEEKAEYYALCAGEDWEADNEINEDEADFEEYIQDAYKQGYKDANEWIKFESPTLPPHDTDVLCKRNDGKIFFGKVTYFEHGDCDLTLIGRGLPIFFKKYRNCENSNIVEWKEI